MQVWWIYLPCSIAFKVPESINQNRQPLHPMLKDDRCLLRRETHVEWSIQGLFAVTTILNCSQQSVIELMSNAAAMQTIGHMLSAIIAGAYQIKFVWRFSSVLTQFSQYIGCSWNVVAKMRACLSIIKLTHQSMYTSALLIPLKLKRVHSNAANLTWFW